MWKSAADDGNNNAFFPLGLCYAYGFGTEFNFKKALAAFSVAERSGINEAKDEVKRLIDNKKRAYARKFYSAAMRLIYTGKFEVAVSYLEAANELSYPKATYTLGCLYEFSRGVAQDKGKAYALYSKADELGFFDNRSKYKQTILRMLKK